jgi:hypothetical protein
VIIIKQTVSKSSSGKLSGDQLLRHQLLSNEFGSILSNEVFSD